MKAKQTEDQRRGTRHHRGHLFGYPGLDIENKCWFILGMCNLKMPVLICGINGSYIFAPKKKSFVEMPKVEVVDTHCVGHSFTGSFTTAILEGKTIEEAHKRAVRGSAYVCTQNVSATLYIAITSIATTIGIPGFVRAFIV